MLDWLLQKRQTPPPSSASGSQVLVSAVNEDLDRMAAVHGFQVFWLGFLARADAYEMGVPAVPLRELYDWRGSLANTSIRLRCPVERIHIADSRVTCVTAGGESLRADFYVSRCRSNACRRRAGAGHRAPTVSNTRRSPAFISGSIVR